MGQAKDVLVPDLGDFKNVPVIGILVEPGAVLEAEDPLIELESDKATMEVPVPFAGTIEAIKVAIGDTVSSGDLILTALPADSNEDTAPSPADKPETASAPLESPKSEPASAGNQAVSTPLPQAIPSGHVYAGPSIRKYARELGVDLLSVTATGPKGRILREDVQAFVKSSTSRASAPEAPPAVGFAIDLPAWPEPDYSKFGEIEHAELSRIQKLSAGNLARNWVTIPHVTNFDKADVTETDAYRKQLNDGTTASTSVKITMLTFMMKASVAALKAYPKFNVSFAGGGLIQKHYFHIGFAADTPNGLVVAVIRDCDRKGLMEIARETADLAAEAREGKLTSAEMSGGCFTVSSLGGIGGTGFTPIINAPEVAILGATRAEIQPVWTGTEFVPRLIQPLALSWDHRAVDGAAAARFLRHLGESLTDIRRIVM